MARRRPAIRRPANARIRQADRAQTADATPPPAEIRSPTRPARRASRRRNRAKTPRSSRTTIFRPRAAFPPSATPPQPRTTRRSWHGCNRRGQRATTKKPGATSSPICTTSSIRIKQNLDVMQRELGVLNVQYYNDPVKAMQQQFTPRATSTRKPPTSTPRRKQIEADQQAIDDAEDDLRKAGGDPGWAR